MPLRCFTPSIHSSATLTFTPGLSTIFPNLPSVCTKRATASGLTASECSNTIWPPFTTRADAFGHLPPQSPSSLRGAANLRMPDVTCTVPVEELVLRRTNG